jgi:acetyl esterase/lipase
MLQGRSPCLHLNECMWRWVRSVDTVYDALAYYIALKKAGVPAGMHLYARGGHAFGLRRTKFPITGWPQLVETWLGAMGMILPE